MKIKRLYLGVVQRIKCFFLKKKKNNIYVLMFHNIYDGESVLSPLDMQVDSFKKMISKMVNDKALFACINDIFYPSKEKKYYVTFDDVSEGVYLNAIPILNAYRIPFVLFVSPCFIDQEGYITSKQLKELKENPLCTIGFHSNNHHLMRQLNNEEVKKEIDCRAFEQRFDILCEFFAYPYGSVYACSYKTIDILRKSGKYSAAFGTINSSINYKKFKKNMFYLPRLTVSDKSFERVG